MTASVKGQATREEFAERLLKGSVRKSYAPIVDIDWDAPIDPDKYFLPPKVVSLYGTPIWEAMSRAEQIELSRQELVNTLSAGILSLIHISEPTRRLRGSRMPSSA